MGYRLVFKPKRLFSTTSSRRLGTSAASSGMLRLPWPRRSSLERLRRCTAASSWRANWLTGGGVSWEALARARVPPRVGHPGEGRARQCPGCWVGVGAGGDALGDRPPGRGLVDQLLGLLAGVGAEAGGNRAGLHFHHLDGEGRQLQTQGVGQGMHRGLGGAVGAGEGGDQHARDAADIHHQALALAQQRKAGAGHADQREHIGFELLAHGLDAAVQQWAHGAVTGVIDQHIEAAGVRLQAFGQPAEGQAIVDVQLDRVEAGGAELRDIGRLARAGPDAIAGLLEDLGQGAADAAGAAGDQDCGLAHAGFLVVVLSVRQRMLAAKAAVQPFGAKLQGAGAVAAAQGRQRQAAVPAGAGQQFAGARVAR